MTRILISTVIFFYCGYAFPQGIKSKILDNTREIKSIDQTDTTFHDLQFLKELIGEKRIVMMGEQDHGDAPTFEAKSRLVKFLHQEMGFEVIAFEADFFGVERSWSEREVIGLDTVIRCIYPMWWGCEQNTVFDYLRDKESSETPLIIAGFDSRHVMVNWARPNYYMSSIKSLIKDLGLTAHDSCSRFLSVLEESMKFEYRSKASETDKSLLRSFLDTINIELNEQEIRDKLFWRQELRNTLAHSENGWDTNWVDNVDYREQQMADNLLWLANEKYAQKKIIVWGANYHISKNSDKAIRPEGSEQIQTSVGSWMQKTMIDDMYVMGFTSYSGQGGRVTIPNDFDIPEPDNVSFETWIHSTGYDYAYTKMTNENLSQDQWYTAKLFSHQDPMKGNWDIIFDGVFYIKNMYPCTPK